MSSLLEKFLSSPARRCPRCGGSIHRLTPAGALCCVFCSPGDSVAVLVADDAAGANASRLAWRQWSEDFDGPLTLAATQSPAVATAAGGAGGVTAGAATSGRLAEPFEAGLSSRVDPPSPSRLVIVDACRLEWFEAAPGSLWAGRTIEIAHEFSSPGWPAPGVYRPMSQPYFAWLLSAVDGLQPGDRADGLATLREIVVAAVDAGVFGEWATFERNWPRRPPVGYQPQRATPEPDRWLWDWDAIAARSVEREAAALRLREVFEFHESGKAA